MTEPKLRLVPPSDDDTIAEWKKNLHQSFRTQIASTSTRRTCEWLKSGLSDQRRIDFKWERSSLSETRSSLMATMGCLLDGLKILVKYGALTGRSQLNQSFFMLSRMRSQRLHDSGTDALTAARYTPQTLRAENVRSLRSSAASNESYSGDSTDSPTESKCFALSEFPLSSSNPAPDYQKIFPKNFNDNKHGLSGTTHARTDPVYSSTSGRDAALENRYYDIPARPNRHGSARSRMLYLVRPERDEAHRDG